MYLALKSGKTSFCHLAQIGQPTEAYSTSVTLALALPRSMSSLVSAAPPPAPPFEHAARLTAINAVTSATRICDIVLFPPEPVCGRALPAHALFGAECDLSLAGRKASWPALRPLKPRRSY